MAKNNKKSENSIKAILNEGVYKRILLIALLAIVVIFIFINFSTFKSFFNKILSILSPIIFGWVLAFLISPLYDRIEAWFNALRDKKVSKFSKTMATIICGLIVIFAAWGMIILFVPQLYSSISNFASRASGYSETVTKWIADLRNNSSSSESKAFFLQLEKIGHDFIGKSGDITNIDLEKIFSSVASGFYLSLKIIINFFIGIIVMLYTLNMKKDLISGCKRLFFAFFEKETAKKIIVEFHFANKVFSGFLVGKLLDSLIIGVFCYICCLIMGMPYTPLISLIVGITNIIPFFGPFIGAIPSFIIILLETPFTWHAWGFLIFILLLQQLDGNIIGPKILGDTTGVPPFWVLFSILFFGGLFGFIGMIVAVPLWAIIIKLFDEYVVIKLKEKNLPLTVDEMRKYKAYKESLLKVEQNKKKVKSK